MTTRTQIQKGQLLLAEPFLIDPYFRRGVVLLCEHHPDGSMGFMLNKPTEYTLVDLIPDFPLPTAPVYYGGPMQTNTLQYIHNLGELLPGSILVAPGVWLGGDYDELKYLAQHEMVDTSRIRFIVGYAGWSGGQLEEEMEIGSWVVAEMDANYAFKSEPARLWSQVMYNKGDVFEVLADVPDEVLWN
jgi:putative transcriptional regulator